MSSPNNLSFWQSRVSTGLEVFTTPADAQLWAAAVPAVRENANVPGEVNVAIEPLPAAEDPAVVVRLMFNNPEVGMQIYDLVQQQRTAQESGQEAA